MKPTDAEGPFEAVNLVELFSEIRGDLLRMLRHRTHDADIAADLVQDIYLKLDSVRIVFPDRRHARAYLYRIANNMLIDRHRTEARRAQTLASAQVLFEDTEVDPETIAVTQGQIALVARALAELPGKCRSVLMLARVNGLTHKEIAKQLGVSVSLVEKYHLRALRHCRERLENGFPFSPRKALAVFMILIVLSI